MTSVSKDIELETPSGLLEITADGSFCAAEPDVGIMTAWIDDVRLTWTKTGKEFSKAAYKQFPDSLYDQIHEELYQAHRDSL